MREEGEEERKEDGRGVERLKSLVGGFAVGNVGQMDRDVSDR